MEKGAIAQAVEVMGILSSLKQHSLAMALQRAVFICGRLHIRKNSYVSLLTVHYESCIRNAPDSNSHPQCRESGSRDYPLIWSIKLTWKSTVLGLQVLATSAPPFSVGNVALKLRV